MRRSDEKMAGSDPFDGTAPIRHYVEAKDSNGKWFVVAAYATSQEAAQAKLDYERSEQVPVRVVERPEGQETPVQDDTSVLETFDDDEGGADVRVGRPLKAPGPAIEPGKPR